MAILDQPSPQAHLPLTEKEVLGALKTGQFSDDAALKIVVQDTLKAEAYETTKMWVAGWGSANALYQSPFTARYWDGTSVERSSIPFFTLASAVNSLVPQIINGLFFENPPFILTPRPRTSAEASRAVGDILGFQFEDINVREELRLGTINALLFGTAIWKYGWESFTKEQTRLVRKDAVVNQPNPIPGAPNITAHDEDDEFEEEVKEVTISRPFFEHIVNLRHILVDPTLNVPDIRKAKFVVERIYMTWQDLNDLRDQPGFNIPSEQEMIELFLPPKETVDAAIGEQGVKNPQWDMRSEARYEEATIDPFNEPLETLWRWDGKHLMVALQKKKMIYNGDNTVGSIPFFSVGWWDVPESFFSLGLAKTIGAEQRLQQGIVNLWVDNATLSLNGVYVRVRGKSIPTQSIRIAPGKIVDVESQGDFEPLKRLDPVPEAGTHLALSQSRVDQLAGAGALNTSGSSAGHSNLARTATGADLLGGSQTAAPDFIDKLSNQVIVPLLNAFHEMNFKLLPPSMLRRILNDELQAEYMKSLPDLSDIYNARVQFSILAGAKMKARRAMQAQLPIIIQFLTNEQTTQQLAISNHRVDVLQLMRDMYEASDWQDVDDVIVPMTPEEQQRAQMNSPAAKMQAQAQMQQQAQAQKHQDQLEVVNDENIARAGREVLRAALEKSESPEVLTGTPGSQSFSSQ